MGIIRQLTIILPVLLNAFHVHAMNVAYCSSQNTGSGFSSVSNLYQSNGACFQSCLDTYAFAIVQGQECWCSNYIPASTVSTSSCSENCPGYPSDKCGSASAGLYGYISLKKSPSGTAGGASTSSSNSAAISSQASVSNQSSGAFLSFQIPTPKTSSPPVASEAQTSSTPQTTSSSTQSSPSPAILTTISSIIPVIITSVQTATTDAKPVTVLATVTASPSVQTSIISSIQTSVVTSIQAPVVSSVETSVVSITPSTFFAATFFPSSTSTIYSSSTTVDATTQSSTTLQPSPTPTSSPNSISSSTSTSPPSSTSTSTSSSTSTPPSSSSSTLSTVFTPSSSSWTPTPVTSLITTTGIVKTVTVTPTAPPAITEAPSRVSQDSFWSNTGRVAGTFVGVALFIIVAAVIAVWCILRRNRKDRSTLALSTAGGATPQRRPSRLSQMGLLGSNSLQHVEKFVPGMMTGVYSGEKDADDLTTPVDTRASYPRVVDQRLDPNAMWNPIQDNGSRVSVRSFRDDQDYSRRMLRVANPDGD